MMAIGAVIALNGTAANLPPMSALNRSSNDPGAPLNLDSYSPEVLPGKGLEQHPFFYTGQYDFRHSVQRMVVVREGRIVWFYEIPTNASDSGKTLQEFSDATMLSNGNVVFARKTGAGEVTPDKKLIWNYDAPKGCEGSRPN